MSDDQLTVLYRRYGPGIYARCCRMLGGRALADDATRETFMRVFRHLDRAPDPFEALGWIYRIATTYCLNELLPLGDLPLDPDTVERDPERIFADRQLVGQLIGRAPETLRATAWLHHVDGLDEGEVALVLGISRRSVVNHLATFAVNATENGVKIDSTRHLSSYVLDALELDVLCDEEADDARAHLADCRRCRFEFDELSRLRRKFEASVLPKTAPNRRTSPGASRRRWVYVVAPLVAMAASLLVWLRPAAQLDAPELSLKGGPALRLFSQHRSTVAPVRSGATLHNGDAIRFVVEPASYTYLLIASIDGGGKATIYYPWHGTESAPIPRGTSELGGSIVLDDSPGPERLFAIFSKAPISSINVLSALQPVRQGGASAIRTTQSLAIEGGQFTLFFEKAP